MKIKRGRLQQIIREELTRVLSEQADNDPDKVDIVDVETGEVLYIGAGSKRGIPAAKADEFIEKLSLSVRGDDKDGTERSIELSTADFEKLEDHIYKTYDMPERERAAAADKAERQRLEPENVRKAVEDWASDFGAGYREDAESGDQPVAFDDLAIEQGIQFAALKGSTAGLKPDEFEALLGYYEDMAENDFRMDNPSIGSQLAIRTSLGGDSADDVVISDKEKKMRYNDSGLGWTAKKYAKEGRALYLISDFVANSMT